MNEFESFTDAELEEMRADLHAQRQALLDQFEAIGKELERRRLIPKVEELLAKKAEIDKQLNQIIGLDTLTLKGETKLG